MQEKITFFIIQYHISHTLSKFLIHTERLFFQIRCKGTATLINTTGKSPESYFLDQKEPLKVAFCIKKRLSKVFFLKNICTIQSFFVPLRQILEKRTKSNKNILEKRTKQS